MAVRRLYEPLCIAAISCPAQLSSASSWLPRAEWLQLVVSDALMPRPFNDGPPCSASARFVAIFSLDGRRPLLYNTGWGQGVHYLNRTTASVSHVRNGNWVC